MTDVFYWLLNMSITGTVAGLIVLLLRAMPRLPRRVVFLFWAIPLFRLWFPALIVSRYSLIAFFAPSCARSVPLAGEWGIYTV